MGHSSKSGRGFGDSHPSGARCLCQGVLVQCRVAHRYPPGSSFPIEFCVTCVMLARWNGPSGWFWLFLCIAHVTHFLGAFERTQGHSSKSGRGFGDSHPSSARCLCQGVLVQCRVAHRYRPESSFPIKFGVTCVMLARWNGPYPIQI